ncbi:MAG: pyridoxamine 5'-phosphate oxidase family protein [Phycisphaerales bacterium]|nr:pyridoxamine 5'-phosphate oxidase family protein [Phycisphaerales bacterium]
MQTINREVEGDAERLAEMIKDIRVAMFTTRRADGTLHTRPMYTQVTPFSGGVLWFFTSIAGEKAAEIAASPDVLITYDGSAQNRYIAVRGYAEVVRDAGMARELWSVHAKAWWPGGPEDPDLALIRVRVESAEYWDGPSKTGYALSLLKAVVTGSRIDPGGEHGVVHA